MLAAEWQLCIMNYALCIKKNDRSNVPGGEF